MPSELRLHVPLAPFNLVKIPNKSSHLELGSFCIMKVAVRPYVLGIKAIMNTTNIFV